MNKQAVLTPAAKGKAKEEVPEEKSVIDTTEEKTLH
jgi:hypothetical protein